MDVNRWLRSKARLFVDWCYCSSAAGIDRVGDKDSGWVVQTVPPPRVAYCAGVGKGMSFEIELARVAGRPVLVFDPSPTGIATVQALPEIDNLTFFPVGMAAETGVVEFSVPRDAGEGSYSVAQDDLEKVSFECWSLKTIMDKRGDTAIDLLKMDIEGFEYDIVEQMLDEGIRVRQLCVELHPWLKPGRTRPLIKRLRKARYRIIYKHHGDYTFLLR
jgi:FkbM family methyltransferase